MTILARSLNREVTIAMLAACAVLLMVSIASQFRVYIEAVARGALEAKSVAPIMFSLLPQFLSLILPIAFYIGLIIGLVRWYRDNELIILHTAGASQVHLAKILFPTTIVITVICFFLQFFLVPYGVESAARIHVANDSLDAFDLITPRRFTPLAQNMQIYTDGIEDSSEMKNIFVYSFTPQGVLALLSQNANLSKQDSQRYLRLNQGLAYSLDIEANSLARLQFVSSDIDITPEVPRIRIDNKDALPTSALIQSKDPELRSLLWWRISLALIVPALFFGAIVTQRITPRKSTGLRLLGVFVLCVGYFILLYIARAVANEAIAPAWMSYLLVHFSIFSFLFFWHWRFHS